MQLFLQTVKPKNCKSMEEKQTKICGSFRKIGNNAASVIEIKKNATAITCRLARKRVNLPTYTDIPCHSVCNNRLHLCM